MPFKDHVWRIAPDSMVKLQSLKNYTYRATEYITNFRMERKIFKKKLGYELDLKNPQSFNHKVVWKKLYDRNPLLPIIADKYAVRQYLVECLGNKKANSILVPIYFAGDNPKDIPFDLLPSSYILKANHGSGTNYIVENSSYVNKDEIISMCDKWLKQAPFKMEWAYHSISRKIIIEKLLKDVNGQIPKDYKFSMIHGRCEVIEVLCDRFRDMTISLYDSRWNPIDVAYEKPRGPAIEKPINLSEMLALAEELSKPFDYIRVDLYSIGDAIYFGELTNYPAGGVGGFEPREFDFELGQKWHMKKDYWRSSPVS